MASAGPDGSRLSAEQEAALSTLVAHADLVAGDAAVVRRRSLTGLAVDVIEVTPHNPRAAPVAITAEQWLIVVVGRGRWELDYSDTDIALAKRLMDAAVSATCGKRTGSGGVAPRSRSATGRGRARTSAPGCSPSSAADGASACSADPG